MLRLLQHLNKIIFPFLYFCLITIVTNKCFAQNQPIYIAGKLVNGNDQKPLPFVKVYNQTTRKGTISNYDGYYKISLQSLNDTIRFSFIGFEERKLTGNYLIKNKNLVLSESQTELSKVHVLADDAILYQLINSTKKSRNLIKREAQTYYGLETFVNNKQVELLEGYYNGAFVGYDVEDLKLKKGRSALNVENEMIYPSLDISKAFYLHDLFENNSLFPHSPFEMNKRKMRKAFELNLHAAYKDREGRTIYAIDFSPRKNDNHSFSGTVWIDSSEAQIHKIELSIDDAKTFPFSETWSQGYNRVEMHITKTFQAINGEMVLNAVYFDYDLDYRVWQDIKGENTVNRKSRAVLHAYDYTTKFNLPYFNFQVDAYDYRNISAAEYDPYFWENYNAFKVNVEGDKNEKFYQEADYTDQVLFDYRGIGERKSLFESNYIFWDRKRVYFAKNLIERDMTKAVKMDYRRQSMFNLDAQIYFDIIDLEDTLYVYSRTVLDPFNTYYLYEVNSITHVFLNTYFDLVELHRRKLMAAIQAEKNLTVEKIQLIYDRHNQEFKSESHQFFRTVQHGENLDELIEWNDKIYANLKVNNMAIFVNDYRALK